MYSNIQTRRLALRRARAYQNKEYFEELGETEGKLNFLRGIVAPRPTTSTFWVAILGRSLSISGENVCGRLNPGQNNPSLDGNLQDSEAKILTLG
jgi:hypothetical protein